MTAVDPYVYPKIPRAFAEDPEVLAWFQFNNRWAHDMWRRTGGGDDDVANQQIQELYPWKSGIENKDEINFSQVQFPRGENKPFIIATTVDYTTTGSDFVIADGKIVVTLNPNPEENELVFIKRIGGTVQIDPGTKELDGLAKPFSVTVKNATIPCGYSVEKDAWFIR